MNLTSKTHYIKKKKSSTYSLYLAVVFIEALHIAGWWPFYFICFREIGK